MKQMFMAIVLNSVPMSDQPRTLTLIGAIIRPQKMRTWQRTRYRATSFMIC